MSVTMWIRCCDLKEDVCREKPELHNFDLSGSLLYNIYLYLMYVLTPEFT